MRWRQLRRQFLPHCGTDPNLETKVIAWESTDLYFPEPDIPVVANTRWLGSMAGRWLGDPMECPSSLPTPVPPPPDTLERDLKPGEGAEPKRHDATQRRPHC
jgi:hypothetical protein